MDDQQSSNEDDNLRVTDRTNMSTSGLIRNDNEELKAPEQLEDYDEQDSDYAGGSQPASADRTTGTEGMNRNTGINPEGEGDGKQKSEKESYVDYNGNSEENAPIIPDSGS